MFKALDINAKKQTRLSRGSSKKKNQIVNKKFVNIESINRVLKKEAFLLEVKKSMRGNYKNKLQSI